MASRTRLRKLRVEEFLEIQFNSDNRFELVDGVIYAMAGGSAAHARVQANLMRFLGPALRGTGCRPYGPDMALKTMAHTLRYPDVTVYCGNPGEQDDVGKLTLPDPRVVIEVLSPSTRSFDQSRKLEEYQSLASVATIAIIDAEAEWVRVHQRETNGEWDIIPEPDTGNIPMPSLDIVIPNAEIFARD